MNPEMPQMPHDESESSLTALLLGELPHEQAAALHQKLAQDAELAKRYERLRHTINLVRETLATPAAQTADQPTPLKLSEQRRAKLLQHFKTVAPKEFLPPRRRGMLWLVPVGIAAAFVVIVGSLAIPNFQAARTKSMGALSWGDTHAASEEPYAKLRRLAPTHGDRSEDLQAVTRRLDQASSGVQPPSTGTPLALPRMKADEAATPAGVAIVLPKSTEVIDATTTPTGAEGQQPGFAVSATLRGFYDDSLNRAGGMGGGGGFGGGGVGGSGGGVQGDGAAVEGRQKELAAADYFFSPQGQKDALASGRPMVERERMQALGDSPPPPVVADNSGQTLEYKADGIVPIVGPDGAPLPSAPQSQDLAAFRARYGLRREPAKGTGTGTGAGINAWQYPNNATAGDAFFSVDAETRRVATVEAQPPAAVPALGATLAPAQESLGQAVTSPAAPVAAAPPAEPAMVANGVEVAGVPSQTLGKEKTAGDLAAGLWGTVPGKPTANVSKAGELHLKQEVAGLDSADKPAEAGAARHETIGLYDLQNADPQDVYNNLHSLIQRNDAPKPEDDQNALAGQTSPVYQRTKNNMVPQPALAIPPAESGLAEVRESKQALAAEGQPVPNSSYYGGGAYGGYSRFQKLPSGGNQGVAPASPALRSPKEGGLAAGISGPAMTPAPSGPQEAAVIEAALSRDNGIASNQRDQKALGFDWYLGNSLAGESRLAVKGGTAPSQDGQNAVEAKKTEELAKRSESAPAFKGTPHDLPVLGDVAVAGRLFRSTTGGAGGSAQPTPGSLTTDQANDEMASLAATRGLTEERIKSTDVADFDRENQKITAGGQSFSPDSRGVNVHGLDVVGYADAPLTATNTIAGFPGEPSTIGGHTYYRLRSQLGTDLSKDANGASRPAQSPIVLPAAQPETHLALQDSGAAVRRPEREAKKESEENIPVGALDFEQAKPDQVLDLYGKLVNRQILRPAALPAPPITFSTSTPLTKQQTVQALEGALALNGITMVNVGDKFMKAVPEAQGNTSGTRFDTKSSAQLSELDQYVTQVVQLHHATPSELVPALQPLAKAPNAILAIDGSRMLVFRDSPENAKRMAEMVAKLDAAGDKEDPALEAAHKPTAPAPVPQPEVQTADNAFSTFSLNVSDVSFKLAAASLEKGVMPEPATVRSEEFINAFDYRDPEPPAGVPVAFAWERAQYPFAQNRDLLRFSIKTAALGRQPGRPLNIVLLLDNSGSMERADRVRIIREALRVLAGQLQPQDLFSVVTFARTAHLWVDGVPGSQAEQVAEEVSGLTPEGGTNLEDAMNLAYQTALRHYLASGVNRVVLLTDGAANLGNVDPEALKQKVEAHRKQGVALDCFGIGWEGYNDDLLEVLARNGDGRYAFLNSPEEVASEFAAKLAGALQVAASDVKVQVEFNPGRVTAYRQIGYAKHQLTKEQFRDNTVNAAQIGAAEAGNALYTVEVNPAGTGPLGTVRVRFRIPGTQDYREHAWDVPFTGNAVALEQASPAMRLAATGSALSEWLASSPYAGEVTTDRLLGYLSGVPEVYGADARPKKLEWMIRQAKSISGK